MKTITTLVRRIALAPAALYLSQTFAAPNDDNPLARKCARFTAAVTGLNYHRSEADDITRGKIWHFGPKRSLSVFDASAAGITAGTTPLTAEWRIDAEDERCVFRIAGLAKPGQIQTFRITDTTWAILKIRGEEKHIPDFEDHTGMKMRYCGIGKICEKLWK